MIGHGNWERSSFAIGQPTDLSDEDVRRRAGGELNCRAGGEVV